MRNRSRVNARHRRRSAPHAPCGNPSWESVIQVHIGQQPDIHRPARELGQQLAIRHRDIERLNRGRILERLLIDEDRLRFGTELERGGDVLRFGFGRRYRSFPEEAD